MLLHYMSNTSTQLSTKKLIHKAFFFAISLFILATLNPSWAQNPSLGALSLGGQYYVELGEFATSLNYPYSTTSGSFTLRSPQGILIVYSNSPDIDWTPVGGNPQESSQSMSAPVIRKDAQWFVPSDVYALLGISIDSTGLRLSDGRLFSLRLPSINSLPQSGGRSEVVELANSVSAISLYSSSLAGTNTISLMLVDLSLLALAYPEQRSLIDNFIGNTSNASNHRLLFFVISALESISWQGDVVFSQGTRRFSAQHPQHISLLSGDSRQVSPDAPITGIILLPKSFDLRSNITILWKGSSANFQFSR